MTEATGSVASFYDNYIDQQKQLAYNKRHMIIEEQLKELGLNEYSNILEIGCGIGIITSLMAKTITKGKIVSMDISPLSVELARERLYGCNNVEFQAGDIIDLQVTDEEYDFIILCDVLEHIPIDSHDKLFRKLAYLMNDKTVLFIHIPNPQILEYLHRHEPESLQVIDQPLYADHIIKLAYDTGLLMEFFRTYSVFDERDYQMMWFVRKTAFVKIPVPEYPLTVWQRIRHRLL